jgi:hypothetical protein
MTDDLHDNVRGVRPANLRPADWEWEQMADRVIRQTAEKVDLDRKRRGLLPLSEEPMTWEQRSSALRFILSGPQDASSVAAAGAQCRAFLVALLRSEDGNPFTGGGQAA